MKVFISEERQRAKENRKFQHKYVEGGLDMLPKRISSIVSYFPVKPLTNSTLFPRVVL